MVRSLLFNYENQATRDVLLINWDEVYIIFFTKLIFWPGLIHQLAETLPLIFLGPRFLSNPHFVPAVAPSCDPATDTGNEDPAAKSPQFCQFSDRWIFLVFRFSKDIVKYWLGAISHVGRFDAVWLFEGLMPVTRPSCHQAQSSSGIRGPGDVTSQNLRFSKILNHNPGNSLMIHFSFKNGPIENPDCSEKRGSPLIIFYILSLSNVWCSETHILAAIINSTPIFHSFNTKNHNFF